MSAVRQRVRLRLRVGAALEAGLGPEGRRATVALLAIALVKSAAIVVLADAIVRVVVAAAAGEALPDDAVVVGAAAAVARGLASWAGSVVAARAASGATTRLRGELLGATLRSPLDRRRSGGAVATLGGTALEAVETYALTVLPAATTAAVLPVVIGLRVLSLDLLSAVILGLTLPLVPLFMALVGMHTRDRVDAATGALERLGRHLVELAAGLPVLVGLGHLERQTRALDAIAAEHRRRAGAALRVAFLSALVLELVATMSVAVIAVVIGVRLVGGDLDLATGLLVLVLVPDCYLAFRELGTAFHAAEDGRSVLDRARAVVGAASAPARGGRRLGAEHLTIHYPGRAHPAVHDLTFDVPPGSVTALVGPSGSGKSTVLAALRGALGADTTLTGVARAADPARLAWVPQQPAFATGTARAELALAGAGPAEADELLDRVGLAARAAAHPATLSLGEQRRLALARALVRVGAGTRVLLLDEPTAHLDPASRWRVHRILTELPEGVTVVVATHDPRTLSLADRIVELGEGPGAVADDADAGAGDTVVATVPDRGAPASAATRPVTTIGTARLLARVLRPAAPGFAGGIALGAGATLAGLGLTAVSAWLIVEASTQPPILTLMVAIVGVRFFGLVRASLRYAERLTTHQAVFLAADRLRSRLWRALAARGVTERGLLGGASALELLVGTIDRVRDLVPRVVQPIVVGAVTVVASIVVVALLDAPAALPVAGVLLVAGLLAPIVTVLAGRTAARRLTPSRNAVAAWFASAVLAADDLAGNGLGPRALTRLTHLGDRADRAARRSALATGAGAGVVLAATGVGAVLVATLRAGHVAPGIVAVEALLLLAVAEPLLAVVTAVRTLPVLQTPLAQAAGALAVPAAAPAGSVRLAPERRVQRLELDGVAIGWPGAAPLAHGLRAEATPGSWLVVRGPSGAGKSTLLATLLGFIPPHAGAVRLDGRPLADLADDERRRRIAWVPQDAHVFDSTVRANLLLAREPGAAPGDDELRAALTAVGLSVGLDDSVGEAGARLSGGERRRLAIARALLTGADILLLDEPTAHLPVAAGAGVLAAVRAAAPDRLVVLVTHDDRVDDPRDSVLRLGPTAQRPLDTAPSEPLQWRGAPITGAS